jgi:hypothetical protein
MSKKAIYEAGASTPGAERVTVAYHAGPPEIGFYRRDWTRGAPQTIPADDWAAMRARGDFNEFDFEEEN